MRLENINLDCADPALIGQFWADALGAEVITRDDGLWEARLRVGEFWMDLCFESVPDSDPAPTEHRLHFDLAGGSDPSGLVARLMDLGAQTLDVGQGQVPWTVLADPEGRPFCVLEDSAEYRGSGPVAALPLHSAEPERDAQFWGLMSGWRRADHRVVALQHPAGVGPLLEFVRESSPKASRGEVKNRMHLDVRPTDGETRDELVSHAVDHGARVMIPAGELPWTVMQDPSGNEFCVLEEERT